MTTRTPTTRDARTRRTATVHGLRLGLPALLATTLAACGVLGGGTRERAVIYAPDPRVAADPAWPAVDWQLSLTTPTAARLIDSFRIAVRPTPNELQVYSGASWAKTPTDMIEDALLRALEDSGRIRAVARQGSGVAADYKLVTDLRRFEADYDGNPLPTATIELNAKLLHSIDQTIVASRTFLVQEPSRGTGVVEVTDAFSRSLGMISGDLAGWVLQTGETHDRTAHGAGGTPAQQRAAARARVR